MRSFKDSCHHATQDKGGTSEKTKIYKHGRIVINLIYFKCHLKVIDERARVHVRQSI